MILGVKNFKFFSSFMSFGEIRKIKRSYFLNSGLNLI